MNWLKYGDHNTGFSHATTRGRRAANLLSVLEDEEGTIYYEEEQISQVVTKYYHDLFSTNCNNNFQLVEEVLQPRVSPAINENFITIPTDSEIRQEVFSIHGDKAPGPDDFLAAFYHSFWDFIGQDVAREVKGFFETKTLHHRHNETHVRLIPKILGPRKVGDYRPIALCSTHYKIIAKIITGRIQPLLSDLISPHQSVFVPKRAISDNVLITHEILHFFQTLKAKKHCAMAVKTDMSKAYDRIEWGFLKAVLNRLGFHATWIEWIMECVKTVTYSFLINRSPKGMVTPSRGLRQGDPLSPYLFILCTEVLSGLCMKGNDDGSLPGVRVACNSPPINHLLFADDTMFFTKMSSRCCKTLVTILKRYEEASGKVINLTKSAITFFSKAPVEVKQRVKRSLKIRNEGGLGKYLGLPEYFGRKKKDIFTGIVDKSNKEPLLGLQDFSLVPGS